MILGVYWVGPTQMVWNMLKLLNLVDRSSWSVVLWDRPHTHNCAPTHTPAFRFEMTCVFVKHRDSRGGIHFRWWWNHRESFVGKCIFQHGFQMCWNVYVAGGNHQSQICLFMFILRPGKAWQSCWAMWRPCIAMPIWNHLHKAHVVGCWLKVHRVHIQICTRASSS